MRSSNPSKINESIVVVNAIRNLNFMLSHASSSHQVHLQIKPINQSYSVLKKDEISMDVLCAKKIMCLTYSW